MNSTRSLARSFFGLAGTIPLLQTSGQEPARAVFPCLLRGAASQDLGAERASTASGSQNLIRFHILTPAATPTPLCVQVLRRGLPYKCQRRSRPGRPSPNSNCAPKDRSPLSPSLQSHGLSPTKHSRTLSAPLRRSSLSFPHSMHVLLPIWPQELQRCDMDETGNIIG